MDDPNLARGDTLRAAAHRSLSGKSTLKRFNSSNGLRLQEQSTRDAEDEEEKYPQYTRTPAELQTNDKLTGSFMNLAHQVTITPNREVIIKGKDDLDIENDETKATNNISTGRHLHFRPFTGDINDRPELMKKNGYWFRFFNADVKIIRYTFEDNGFRENNNVRNQDWLVMWSNNGFKSDIYQTLTRYQKVNHFPRSSELTRKDSMYARMARMQAMYGDKHFNFIPKTFILPKEYASLTDWMMKERDQTWIVKPSASSQGRGIFITSNIEEINQKTPQVVCQYIDNPLLFNGYKFDLRIYVAITSIWPLRIYMYREGLARLATMLYNSIPETKNSSKWTHLTNYSINKHNANFKQNDNAGTGDASKLGFKDTNEYLKKQGVDIELIWRKIEDVIIKTILSVEPLIHNGMEMYVPFKTNCFECLGFDILIDENIEPWLIEVNLSPSMGWDSPFDHQIKSNLVADLFTLIGVPAIGPKIMQVNRKRKGRFSSLAPVNRGIGILNRSKGMFKNNFITKQKHRNFFDHSLTNKNSLGNISDLNDYSKEDKKFIKDTEDEIKRNRGFKMIFPNENMLYYEQFFEEKRKVNEVIWKRLFGMASKGHPARVQRMRKAGDFIFKSKLTKHLSAD